jgi:hypothetical protein
MKLLRTKVIRFALLTAMGLSFLNLSFFMAEVAALETFHTKEAMENIAKMLCLSMTEEEQDASESTEEHVLKGINLLSHTNHLQFEESWILVCLRNLGARNAPHSGYPQIVTPPPDAA